MQPFMVQSVSLEKHVEKDVDKEVRRGGNEYTVLDS
jgi:hypothetical protein